MNKLTLLILSPALLYFSLACKDPRENEEVKTKLKSEVKIDSVKTEVDYSKWTKYDIKGFGEIYIPPEMEVQSGKFKELNDKYREITGLTEEQIVFQQTGLNNFEEDAKNSYSRVLIKTNLGKKGDFGSLNNISSLEDELKDFETQYKNELTKKMNKQNIKITEWFPIEIKSVNGMEAMLISYKRQLGVNPEAYVRMFLFFNNDRFHLVTLSYRITDKEKWEPLFENILNKIKINEIE